jgi:hypothetical protein
MMKRNTKVAAAAAAAHAAPHRRLLLPTPPTTSVPTLEELKAFVTQFYVAAACLSQHDASTGETSLVVFGMSLTKPSGKEVVMILGANDQEQARLIVEAIQNSSCQGLPSSCHGSSSKREMEKKGNKERLSCQLHTIDEVDDLMGEGHVEHSIPVTRPLDALDNTKEGQSPVFFCPPNANIAIKCIEAIYQQCNPIVRMLASPVE